MTHSYSWWPHRSSSMPATPGRQVRRAGWRRAWELLGWPRPELLGWPRPSQAVWPFSGRLAGQNRPSGRLEFSLKFHTLLNARNYLKVPKSVENYREIIKIQNNFFLESFWADLPRKHDHIVIFFIYLCIKIHESKHCLSYTKMSTHDPALKLCMSTCTLSLSPHKIDH
jgi:hypothetical protein